MNGSMWRSTGCALLLGVASPALRAQEAHVSAKGSVVTITSNGVRHRITLPDSVRVDMDTVEVLDLQNVLATSYLLLTVNGPSKRVGFGAGQCGAGYETGVVWLQLLSWRVQRLQSRLVESCWKNVMITGTIDWQADIMRMTFLDLKAGSKGYVLRYDRARPERGFTVTADSAGK